MFTALIVRSEKNDRPTESQDIVKYILNSLPAELVITIRKSEFLKNKMYYVVFACDAATELLSL